MPCREARASRRSDSEIIPYGSHHRALRAPVAVSGTVTAGDVLAIAEVIGIHCSQAPFSAGDHAPASARTIASNSVTDGSRSLLASSAHCLPI